MRRAALAGLLLLVTGLALIDGPAAAQTGIVADWCVVVGFDQDFTHFEYFPGPMPDKFRWTQYADQAGASMGDVFLKPPGIGDDVIFANQSGSFADISQAITFAAEWSQDIYPVAVIPILGGFESADSLFVNGSMEVFGTSVDLFDEDFGGSLGSFSQFGMFPQFAGSGSRWVNINLEIGRRLRLISTYDPFDEDDIFLYGFQVFGRGAIPASLMPDIGSESIPGGTIYYNSFSTIFCDEAPGEWTTPPPYTNTPRPPTQTPIPSPSLPYTLTPAFTTSPTPTATPTPTSTPTSSPTPQCSATHRYNFRDNTFPFSIDNGSWISGSGFRSTVTNVVRGVVPTGNLFSMTWGVTISNNASVNFGINGVFNRRVDNTGIVNNASYSQQVGNVIINEAALWLQLAPNTTATIHYLDLVYDSCIPFATPTSTPTPTITPTFIPTTSHTPTLAQSPSPSATRTRRPTITPRPTQTPGGPTATRTFTPRPINTATMGPSRTPSSTFAPIIIPTLVPTATRTPTLSEPPTSTSTPFGISSPTPGTPGTPLPQMTPSGTPDYLGAGNITTIGGGLISIVSNTWQSATRWIGTAGTTFDGVLEAWNTAPPRPVPGLPICMSDPLSSELCAIWYILRWTVFAGSVGSLIMPLATAVVDMGIVFVFIKMVRAILARAAEVVKV